MAEQKVAVSIWQEAEYDAVVEACQARGLQVSSRLEELSLLYGRLEAEAVPSLLEVPGVVGVVPVTDEEPGAGT